MKKIFFFTVALLMGVTSVFAQSSMLATLNHEGTISTFYGTTALREAYTAAASGDVITLSSGTFLATDIAKPVTVRGAGMGIDSTAFVEPTIISGDFNINIADSESERLTIEGIYHNSNIYYSNLNNAMFLKCRFKVIKDKDSSTSILKNTSFIHCRIAYDLSLKSGCSASCVASVIQGPSNSGSDSNFEFINCVLVDAPVIYIHNSSFRNCIISGSTSSYRGYIDNCTAYNCVGLNRSDIFSKMTNSTNTYVSDISSVFKTYKGEDLESLDNERFELTDDAKTKYLGTDGTEVGIYGGNLTYDPVPSNPQITKCNVASKSTADGKLSIDIQVNTAE